MAYVSLIFTLFVLPRSGSHFLYPSTRRNFEISTDKLWCLNVKGDSNFRYSLKLKYMCDGTETHKQRNFISEIFRLNKNHCWNDEVNDI